MNIKQITILLTLIFSVSAFTLVLSQGIKSAKSQPTFRAVEFGLQEMGFYSFSIEMDDGSTCYALTTETNARYLQSLDDIKPLGCTR